MQFYDKKIADKRGRHKGERVLRRSFTVMPIEAAMNELNYHNAFTLPSLYLLDYSNISGSCSVSLANEYVSFCDTTQDAHTSVYRKLLILCFYIQQVRTSCTASDIPTYQPA